MGLLSPMESANEAFLLILFRIPPFPFAMRFVLSEHFCRFKGIVGSHLLWLVNGSVCQMDDFEHSFLKFCKPFCFFSCVLTVSVDEK